LSSEPESDPEDFLSESDPDEESFLAAALAFFGAGFSDSSELSSELDSFLAGAFLSFLATTLTDSEESESVSEDDSTLDFFCGTTAFSVVFLALFLLSLLAAETPEAALDLF